MGVHICNKKQEAANLMPESQPGPIEEVPAVLAHEESFATSPPQAASPENDISIPLFSRRCDSFLTAFQFEPFHSSDQTFSFRSDLWYAPTLRTFLRYKCFFYSEFRGAQAPV